MLIGLKCECCNEELSTDFSANVWCTSPDCLLYDKCYTFDYLEGRRIARINNEPVQQKERLLQGFINEPLN
jgi:hypothetical protein